MPNEKRGTLLCATPPNGFAGDPAPQQLTAPCRKYSGRLHQPIEQGAYPLTFHVIPRIVRRWYRQFSQVPLQFLLAATVAGLSAGPASGQTPAAGVVSGAVVSGTV